MLPIKLARVTGRSLEPKLRNGSFALFRRSRRVIRGDIVLANHSDLGWVVKEVGAIAMNGRIALNGVSRLTKKGSVSRDEVFGKIVGRVPLLRWRTKSAIEGMETDH